MKKRGLFIAILGFAFFCGCKTVDYKRQIENLQRENQELQVKLSEIQKELIYKDTIIENLKKQQEVKTSTVSLPPVEKIKPVEQYDVGRIYQLLKKQNFYGVPKPRKNTIVVIISRNIFQSGSDKLSAKGENEIKKLATVLNLYKPKLIEIKGHTDNTKLSAATAAKFIDNFGLSSARAMNAKKVLLKYLKFDPKKITIEGMGDSKQLTSNKTKEGRDINRRLEFYLYY